MVSKVTEEHINKVKVYEERLNLRRLMHLQNELLDKKKWLRGYELEPNPYLEDAATNIRYRIDVLEKEINMTRTKLSRETISLIE